MLTIFAWGILFSLALIVFSLWKWYFNAPVEDSDDEFGSSGPSPDRRSGDSHQGSPE
ncbi:hypothetical protein [uncultured Brevibacterium sp.]|uniref:hypothetical protein n=1 Tax=uncultured Brevibacterium sp. TaxID=189678 RepID=UPI0025E8AB7A|nr:hypothetical protein [uncultured Brevibacterium sp.]